MKKLEGKNIGIAALRRADEIAALVQKNSGTAFVYSIQGEQVFDGATSEQDVLELLTGDFDTVLLTTGIGAEAIEKTARKMKRFPALIQKLRESDLIIRGSKTVNWLKKHSLQAEIISEDGTMDQLLKTLANEDLPVGKRLFLQGYNRNNVSVRNRLEQIGYEVYLSKPYYYRKPDDQVVNDLGKEIINQSVDAVIFTTKTQVQNLFNNGRNIEQIIDSFQTKVLAVAIGKVTANELNQFGVTTVFQPTKPKMGRMVVELGDYFSKKTVK